MDLGGHRFFSKSDRVMEWWLNILPVQPEEGKIFTVTYQRHSRTVRTEEPLHSSGAVEQTDKVMLVRKRLSRIYFLRKFFNYPIQLSFDTLKKLGLVRTVGILASYVRARLFPRNPEKSLEDFLINRFGNKLYRLFFSDYTEKVWGVPCKKISAEWGAQRIKGISVWKAMVHAVRSLKPLGKAGAGDIGQKGVETSLIERFLYPKYGPGQMWEEVARQVEEMGGEVRLHCGVKAVHTTAGKVMAVEVVDSRNGEVERIGGDYFFSTMAVQELIAGMDGAVPENVKEVAAGLQYRDFITVGVLLKKLMPGNGKGHILPDTWIYIQERDVKVGRLQIFNNWSPYMVKDPDTVWVGMEFFCNQGDGFWELADEAIQRRGVEELQKMGLATSEDVLDSTVLRMEKTYPAYFGMYERFEEVRQFTDVFANLFLVGRNGMHKYNNSDHSMLTAMVAVDNIIAGEWSKANIWAINTEQEYHEEKEAQREIVPEKEGMGNYIWRDKWNRAYGLSALVIFLVQLIVFKFRYPFANYMPDSYSYLQAAMENLDVNTWPVAYSKFLRLISVFTHSDKVVAGIQYFFLQCSGLVFLYTLLYFLKPGKVVKYILGVFFLFNPVALYVSNYISADALFIGLSLLWMSQLLWIIYRPRPYHVLIQAVLLLAAFTVRYNAIYYPLVAALAFILSRQGWRMKFAGIGLGVLLVMGSVWYTSNKMSEVTGYGQFSAFGGWQLANNALYMYEHIPAGERGEVPARFAKLEEMVRQHMDTLSRVKLTREDTISAHFYLWSERGPLVQYMVRDWKKDSTTPYFKRWALEAPLFKDYGLYLIRKYPVAYAKEFLLPNTEKYAVPPPEFLSIYNMGMDSVAKLAKDWFNYKTQRVKEHNQRGERIAVTQWYPYFTTLVNVFLLICIIGLAVFTGLRQDEKGVSKLLVLIICFWVLNMGFSILASPVVLRYQVFPVMVSFSVAVIAAEAIYRWGIEQERQLKNQLV
jgi:protoporphyrinogen oxidase